ncbi:MAG: hypothetical protein CVU66_01330 [Deltaproteobacteria bacterium HGW-Deltaproteobacteria-23]|nr:MAG: hypothetical protein CVU66_01330 [Deltaproteobacteria bacterium HGW-Deltaproteobacteria-23]
MSTKFTMLAAALLLAAFSAGVTAETSQAPPQGKGPAAMMKPKGELANTDNRLQLMKTNLGLRDEQVTEIRPIIVAEQAEIEKLRGDSTLNRDQRRAKLEELNKNSAGKIRLLLTPEQQLNYDAIKDKISETRSTARGKRPGTPPVEFTPEKRIARLTEHLKLTKEQQTQILPILENEYTQLKELPANDSYNREQRKARLQQITGETNTKLMPLLTPEQQKHYTETKVTMLDRRSQKKRTTEKQPAKETLK